MRSCSFVVAAVLVFTGAASAQTSEVGKSWNFPRSDKSQAGSAASRVEARDGLTNSKYVQKLEERMAAAAGVPSVATRLTLGAPWYAFLTPDRKLYISAGLIVRTSSEAQLAGLVAHMLAHSLGNKMDSGSNTDQCVLAKNYMPVMDAGARSRELKATQLALGYMKNARFDPGHLLDVLSTVSYEHPAWSSAIASTDLMKLRVPLDAEAMPRGGYATDSGEFAALRNDLIPVELLRMSVKPLR